MVTDCGDRCDPPKPKSFLARLGPGLITGASDDDPSGIATYSQTGARFGYSLLWTCFFTLPLMAAIQEISARIGRISGRGIAGNIRRHYSRWLLYPIVVLLVSANVINLAADIGAMGEALAMVCGGPAAIYAAALSFISVLLQIFVSYRKYSSYLKWLTLVLFSYLAAACCIKIPWSEVLLATVTPKLRWDAEFLATFIAVLGTTISPYLFFWQASMEIEEIRCTDGEEPLKFKPQQARVQFTRIRWDTYVGMALSNLIAFFIVLMAAVTLFHSPGEGVDIESSTQAAKALEPFAGKFAFALFSLGIVGTGMLALPVLAGSAAYAVGEALKWPTGLDRKPLDARGFYAILAISTLLGLALNFVHIDPIKALFWAAVVNGVVAVPIMIVMMRMVTNEKVVGPFTRVSKPLRIMGWLATLVMLLASIGLVATWHS